MPKHLVHGLQAWLQAGSALRLCQRLILQLPERIIALLHMRVLSPVLQGVMTDCCSLAMACGALPLKCGQVCLAPHACTLAYQPSALRRQREVCWILSMKWTSSPVSSPQLASFTQDNFLIVRYSLGREEQCNIV